MNIHNIFLNFTGDPLFISFHGKKMSSSMVTGQLNSFWQKSVGGGDRFNATKMRKVSVTKTHSTKPELKKQLSNLMAHSVGMAEKVYYLEDKTRQAASTSESLRQILRTDNPIEEKEIDEEEAIGILFSEEVAAGKIRIHQVRDKRPSFSKQVEQLSDDQIRDKVRYLVAKKNG